MEEEKEEEEDEEDERGSREERRSKKGRKGNMERVGEEEVVVSIFGSFNDQVFLGKKGQS